MVSVIVLDPASVSAAESAKRGELLVKVTSSPRGGAVWPMRMVALACRLLPIVTPSLSTIPGTLTVIFRALPPAGTAKPGGGVTASVVAPAPVGRNSGVSTIDPPANCIGKPTSSPTAVSVLVAVTKTVSPPRSCCVSTKFRFASRRAGATDKAVLSAPVVVKKSAPMPKGPLNTNPDRAWVTTPMALPTLAPETAYVV